MPFQTFTMKVDELYQQYGYANSPLKIAVLTCITVNLPFFTESHGNLL